MQVLEAQPTLVTSRAQEFMTRVYGWMAAGLMVTAVIAGYTLSHMTNPRAILQYSWPLFGVELLLVIALSAWINKLSRPAAAALFLGYSALNGVSIAPILTFYTQASIAKTFFIAAGTFGGMSLYGLVTRNDLRSVGSFCFMGLIGLIIAGFVNLFLFRSSQMDWILAIVGVIVFVGLTAWDNQKLSQMAVRLDEEQSRKAAITGALTLYLDFINLFLSLLRLLGTRRN